MADQTVAVTADVEGVAVEIKQISEQSHGVVLDMVYATANNVAGVPIYQRPICLLHRDAAHALHTASELARQAGLRLKIFDAFRPHEAQVMLWNSAPDKAYVADPTLGSNHTRGVAVDLTLVDADGQELEMGTGFDDMTEQSHHFRTDISAQAQANRLQLLGIMEQAGFEHIPHEWWHYALPAAHSYPLIPSHKLHHLNPMRAHGQ